VKTSNELYSSVKLAVSISRNFTGPNRETLSKPRSQLKGLILILRILILATIKIDYFCMLLMNTLGSHLYFRALTHQMRASLRH